MANKSGTFFQLSDQQRVAWLQLYRSENVGPATFRDLINHFGSASVAIEAIPDLAKRGGAASRIKICSAEQAEREIALAAAYGARFVGIGEPDYPAILRHLSAAPPLICVAGNKEVLQKSAIGVVGSRNASISGIKLTNRFADGLGKAGFAIVSGLARGVDTAAHKASLETGTIAVFAGGLDKVFPEENLELAKAIASGNGAIISEMPMGWQPRAKDFPRRNRIVAGLSLGVIVVEAARRSGSLITARLATENGRQVFAVPGSPLDPRSEGANHLIREGAILIRDVGDVAEALEPLSEKKPNGFNQDSESEAWIEREPGSSGADPDDNLRERILSALGPTPVYVDDIIRHTGSTPGDVQLVLLEFALAGRIERHANGQISLLM